MKLTNEPSLHEIDDYDNNETPEKRKHIYLIIGLLIGVGVASYFYLSTNATLGDDYVATKDKPGIISTKPF
jgi:hypothetical protein